MDRLKARVQQYEDDYRKFGYSPEALTMPSDRRNIRYYELIKNFTFFYDKSVEFTILDAGCGFADILNYFEAIGIRNYRYIGLDLVDGFLDKANELHGNDERVIILKRNFFKDDLSDLVYDYAISSQAFNNPYSDEPNNMSIIKGFMKEMFDNCKKGIAFNFVIDRVEERRQGIAYHDPIEIMKYAYSFTNNVVMDNSCMPFECTCTMLKETANGKIWKSFAEKHRQDFDGGLFVVRE